MKTINEKLQDNLKKAKRDVKFATHMAVILEAFKNRDQYAFTDKSNHQRELFRSDNIIMFADLRVSRNDVECYETFYFLSCNDTPDNTGELRKALKFVEPNWDACFEIAYQLAKESELINK